MKTIPSLVLFLLLCAPPGFSTQETAARWRVGLRSYGPIVYGMSLKEASQALGESLRLSSPTPEACDYVFPRSVPDGVAFMVLDGHLLRVDVDTAGVETISGGHVGSTETEIIEMYQGRIRTTPHPYNGPEGHYLEYVPRESTDSNYAVIFETNGKVVIRFRAGLHPAVDYIEGCS